MANAEFHRKNLKTDAAHPSRNDQLRKATSNQSTVKPEDYPEADRAIQTDIAGEKKRPKRP